MDVDKLFYETQPSFKYLDCIISMKGGALHLQYLILGDEWWQAADILPSIIPG